jgi:hypothetical protein
MSYDPTLLAAQYRNDLLYPVAEDSRERRLAAIDAFIAHWSGETCRNCAGCQWVCEDHHDHPWAGIADVQECCGGAGAPCPVCSPVMACASYTAPVLDALRRIFGTDLMNENVGWKGHNPSHPDLFKCEYCGVENLDCTLIEHTDACPVPFARAAISRALPGGEGK